MELQQMRYVIAVAEERNFTRAAKRCFVVQSALSHQIKALENELGVALFARTSRRVEVTAAGEAFLQMARTSLDAAERAAADAAAANGLMRGTLTVGVIPTATAVNVPAVLTSFHSAHPDVRIRLRGGGSDEFISAISRGAMDAALLGLAESSPPVGIEARELSRERLVAVVPSTHALAGRRGISLRDLTEEVFVDFPEGTSGRIQSDSAFAAAGLHRDVAFEAMNVDLILGLVREGLAVALGSAKTVGRRDGLYTLPVIDGPVRVEYLAWSSFNPSPSAKAFINAILGANSDAEH